MSSAETEGTSPVAETGVRRITPVPSKPRPRPRSLTEGPDKARQRTGAVAMVGSGFLIACAVWWLFDMRAGLQDTLLKVEGEFTLGLGLGLAAKALPIAAFAGLAIALFRGGERLLMPLPEYLEYVDKTSKHSNTGGGINQEKLLSQIIGAVKEALGDKKP